MAQSHELWAAEEINPTARAARAHASIVTEGVQDLLLGQWAVQEQASPNMSVRVGSGTAYDVAYVKGDYSVGQGTYVIRNTQSYVGDANSDLAISPGDATHSRHDLVVLRVYDDAEDSSGRTEAAVEIVEGSPASSPSDPSTPDSAIVLGRILVTAGENTSITDADISDLRPQSSILTALTNELEDRVSHEEGRVIGTISEGGAGAQTYIQFADIPQDYTQLKLYGQLGHTGSATLHNLHLRFNDDTDNNYYASKFIVNGDTGPAGSYFDNGISSVFTRIGLRGTIELTVPAYNENTNPKAFHMITGAQIGTAASSHEHRTVAGQWYGGGNITKISMFITGGPDFSARTIVTLVGVG